jgi:hypothetical protein
MTMGSTTECIEVGFSKRNAMYVLARPLLREHHSWTPAVTRQERRLLLLDVPAVLPRRIPWDKRLLLSTPIDTTTATTIPFTSTAAAAATPAVATTATRASMYPMHLQ